MEYVLVFLGAFIGAFFGAALVMYSFIRYSYKQGLDLFEVMEE